MPGLESPTKTLSRLSIVQIGMAAGVYCFNICWNGEGRDEESRPET